MSTPTNPRCFAPAARLWVGALGLFATAALFPVHAQTTPSGTSGSARNDIVELNPFEVRTDKDTSYGALNSNSITRFNTELDKVPVSADILTADFMRDVAATSVEEMLGDYGAGTGLASANPEGDAALNQPGDRIGNMQVGTRGLAAGMIHRDGFTPTGSFANPGATGVGLTSTFDVEAVEVIRGPQGLLYGAGGAGGTINTRSKRASFNQVSGSTMFRLDQYGSKQGQFDINFGRDWFAVRVALLSQDQKYRRVFIGYKTRGLYSQLAFKLPFHTILRLQAEYTTNDRINGSSVGNLNFSKSSVDPRHNYSLAYLLATDQAGAVNPQTGEPYPRGAVADGGLNWGNVDSWAGWRGHEYVNNSIYTARAESVWTRWLSSEFTVLFNNYKSDRVYSGIAGLSAPTDGTLIFNGNPLSAWANGVTPQDTEQPTRRTAVRGSILLTNDLFKDRAHSQTSLGYDIEWADAGPTDYTYYLADDQGNVLYDPAVTSNLGRTPVGRLWWPVGSRPVMYPYAPPGWASPRMTVDGQNYVRMVKNPRDPQWVTDNNPLGLASLGGASGVSGQNNRGDVQENRVSGIYASNYTSWFHDRFGTLLGIRANQTFKRNPNTSSSVTSPYAEASKSNSSYNVGFNVRLRSWLRGYYSLSNTYNTPIANANDPLGNAPRTTSGTGQEAGLKFTRGDGRISGSLAYYWTDSTDEMINAGTGTRDLINPSGLNGSYIGPAGAKNQWINLDRTTHGAELILTAAPTRNWRLRVSATTSDGQTLTDKAYPMVYNDQFHLTNGAVTYDDGTAFMVPVDSATIGAKIAKLNRQTDPATLQSSGTWVPLTLAMINDPNNPYWANPADNNGRLQTSNLRRVLQYFVGAHGDALTGATGLPLSDIQYNWSDPNNTKGVAVVARKGEYTLGYPKYKFSVTSMYNFTDAGWLDGVSVGGSVNGGFSYRTYYYNSPDGIRRLFQSPNMVTANLILSYQRKFRRVTWRTQLNVNNLFNHYLVRVLPNNGSGYTNEANLGATFYGQPRMWTWTNTFSF